MVKNGVLDVQPVQRLALARQFKWLCRMGFITPKINTSICTGCGICTSVCKAANSGQKYPEGQFFAAINEEGPVRAASASGGLFSLFAKTYIDQGGIVYGAAFDTNWQVSHIRCSNYKTLGRIQKSKYVQSSILHVYRDIEKDLADGKQVLFSGTACQCSGVKSYINQKGLGTGNLLLVDLICHGVPSPKLWASYIKMREGAQGKITDINFRNKDNSWKDYCMSIAFENGRVDKYRQNEDYFLVLFFHNLILRESCYRCRYASVQRTSDLTLGDYWGITEFHPDFNDDKGASVLLVNSDKGRSLWEACKEGTRNIEISRYNLAKHQINLQHPSRKDKRYDAFWEDYYKKGFDYILKKYADATVFGCLKRRHLYRILSDLGIWDIIIKMKR